jgi:hypothetical protein
VIVELQQNQQRYSKSENLYSISAKKGLKPVTIEVLESDLDIEPLLPFDIRGVIIYLRDYNRYIASDELVQTLADSLDSNPHYTYKEHSSVLGAKMGKTIPIIPIDTKKILDEIEKQKGRISFSGVKSVEWEIDGDNLSNLIKQIVWTLSPSAPKPLDTYTTWDLNLSGDYSVGSLKIEPLDKDAKVDETKLASNLKAINDRLSSLTSDFNTIKDLFYFGKIKGTSTTKHTILSSIDEADDLAIQVITKDSKIAGKEPLVANQVVDVADKKVTDVQTQVESAKTTLTEKINQTENTIKTAQEGDTAAQALLKKQLLDAQNASSATTLNLIRRLKEKGINLE